MKIMFVSSHGGHWKQLQRIAENFMEHEVVFVTTKKVEQSNFVITDCNQNQPFKLLRCFTDCLFLIKKVGPDVIITTGAAPGFLMLLVGRLYKCKIIWIDSIANSEKMSMSGRLAKLLTKNVLTQWEIVSKKENVKFFGRVL